MAACEKVLCNPFTLNATGYSCWIQMAYGQSDQPPGPLIEGETFLTHCQIFLHHKNTSSDK